MEAKKEAKAAKAAERATTVKAKEDAKAVKQAARTVGGSIGQGGAAMVGHCDSELAMVGQGGAATQTAELARPTATTPTMATVIGSSQLDKNPEELDIWIPIDDLV